MKKFLIFLILLSALESRAQEDTTRYLSYTNSYGGKYSRLWATTVLRTPYGPLVPINPKPGAIQAGPDGLPYWWNGTTWNPFSLGSMAAYVKYADTAAMLNPYLRAAVAAATYYPITNPAGYITAAAIASKVNYSDTANMLTPYLRVSAANAIFYPLASNPAGYITSASIAGKLNISDTAAMLSPYLRSVAANGLYYPITGNPSNFLIKTVADTYYYPLSSNPNGYLVSADITGKLNISDTAAMLSPYLRLINANNNYYPRVTNPAGYLVSSDIAGKLNISDTGAMLNPYLRANQSANPTGLIGLTAVNGSASTFMRSDASPALSQAIVPTWTGKHTFSNGITTSGNISTAAWGVKGVNISTQSATYTDNSTTAGTTVSTVTAVNSIAAPTITAGNATSGSPVTYNSAASFYIAGVPLAGPNTVISNPFALQLGGFSVLGGGFSTTASISIGNGANLTVGSASGISSTTSSALLFGGASTVSARTTFAGNTSSSLASGAAYGSIIIGSGVLNTASSGNHPVVSNAVINPPGTITQGGTATIGEIPTLYINGAYGGSFGSADIYALHVAGSNVTSKIDGNLSLKHLVGNSSAPSIAANTGAGTSPTISISGTDAGFTVTLTAGTSPTSGADIFTVTFASAYTSIPNGVALAAIGQNSPGLLTSVYSTPATTTYKLTLVPGASLIAANQYKWSITIIQ